jgi:hypothetical protein
MCIFYVYYSSVTGENMAQKKTIIRKSEIDRRIAAKNGPERSNITFSLPKDLIEAFKRSVKANKGIKGLTMNRVVEELIRVYAGMPED